MNTRLLRVIPSILILFFLNFDLPATTLALSSCTPGVVNTIIGYTGPPLCPFSTQTLSVNGNLNDDQTWEWYTGNCGDTHIGTGASLNVSPGVTTTYYVRAEGNCSGTNGSCVSFTVSIGDTEDPMLTCPQDITVNNDAGQCSAIVDFSAVASDFCSGLEGITYSQDPNTEFPVGTSLVDVTAKDYFGNSANCSFSVTVTDIEEPEVSCQSLTFCKIPGEDINLVPTDLIASLSDNCSAPVDISKIMNQSIFTDADLGANNVTVTVTNETGQSDDCSTVVNLVGFASISAGSQTACDPSFNTYTQELQIFYVTPPGYTGDIIVNGFVFDDIGSPLTVTLTDLPADGQDVDVAVAFEGIYNCTQVFEDVFTAPANCFNPCDITDISLNSVPVCNRNNNGRYDVCLFMNGTAFSVDNGGTVKINGNTVNYTGQEVPGGVILCLEDLPADGLPVDVWVEAFDGCIFQEDAVFTAPDDCQGPACVLNNLRFNSVACDNIDGTFDLSLEVRHNNAPTTGTLDVQVQNNTYSFAIGGSPQTLVVSGLDANGASTNVRVEFSDLTSCFIAEEDFFVAPTCRQNDPCTILNFEINEVQCNANGTYRVCFNVFGSNLPVALGPDAIIMIGGQTYPEDLYQLQAGGALLCVDNLPIDNKQKTVSIQLEDGCKKTIRRLYRPSSFCSSLGNFQESTSDLIEERRIKVFPNPSNGLFTLTSNKELYGNIQVYNAWGKLVKTFTVENQYEMQIDLQNFASGLYFIRIKGDSIEDVKKVLVVE